MSVNPAKREEARRVWRLNKKEGVPVLEALESADISKDTYYEYKSEYESEWEGEITTAKEVERELESLRSKISDLSEKAESVDSRFSEVNEEFEEIEEQVQAERTARKLWDKMERFEWELQRLSEDVGKSYDASERKKGRVDLRQLEANVRQLTERQEKIAARVEESASEKRVSRLEDTIERLKREIKERPKNLMELLFPARKEAPDTNN
jgi:septation ring formation regulator EzrA